MDGPDPVTAKGVPASFRAVEVWRDGAWQRQERVIPGRTDRMRWVA